MTAGREIKEYRADGWPLCPQCEEDELWSALRWDGEGERPPTQAYIDAGLTCYLCQWTSRKSSVADVASAMAAFIIKKRLEQGHGIEIPSLGITIKSDVKTK